jgi:hypothetical protein
MLSLEPDWTISINGKEFIPARAEDIEVDRTMIGFGVCDARFSAWSGSVRTLASGRFPDCTQPDVLTFYPGGISPAVSTYAGSGELFKFKWQRRLANYSAAGLR